MVLEFLRLGVNLGERGGVVVVVFVLWMTGSCGSGAGDAQGVMASSSSLKEARGESVRCCWRSRVGFMDSVMVAWICVCFLC